MRTVRMNVSGMGCRGCVREVTASLRDVAGVETIAADAASGLVVLSGRMTTPDVLAAFAAIGYPVEILVVIEPATTP